jgi:hypothetical protein
MKKITTFTLAVFILSALAGSFASLGATKAQAQSVGSISPNPSTCISFNSNVYYGLSDSYVTTLQNFLISEGYLHVAATGYFGPLTFAAAQSFQAANGITNTGFVGPLTRAKIGSITCTVNPGPIVVNPPVFPIATTTPTTTTSAPMISYVSPTSGSIGSSFTIYGSGFSSINNIVHFGSGTLTGVSSADGTTLSLTVPSQLSNCNLYSCTDTIIYVGPGTYPISVLNSVGTSNSVSFTVTSSSNPSPTPNPTPAPTSPAAASPSISSLNPSSGNVGTQVTVLGSGFTPTNNTVKFGSTSLSGISSNSGSSLVFTVPSQNTQNCNSNGACTNSVEQLPSGDFQVSVSTANGTSNSLTFTIPSASAAN